jgi:hypothetical protein
VSVGFAHSILVLQVEIVPDATGQKAGFIFNNIANQDTLN